MLETIGLITVIFLILLAVIAAAVVIISIPDIRRYLKMRNM